MPPNPSFNMVSEGAQDEFLNDREQNMHIGMFEDEEDDEDTNESLDDEINAMSMEDLRSHLSHMDLGPSSFETIWPEETTEQFVHAFDTFFRYIFAQLILCIMAVGSSPYYWLEEQGCTRTFAYFLLLADQTWLVEKLLAAVPRHVKIILGNPNFKLDDLKMLPLLPIDLLRLYGVYTDLIENLLGYLIYVGSGTGVRGTYGRWESYQSPNTKEWSRPHMQEAYA